MNIIWQFWLERFVFAGTLFHHGTSRLQKQNVATSQAALGENKVLTDTAQGTLGQFEGPVQDSPFYKALKTAGIESTSNAYGNARSNMRQRANLSGFGYNQPVEEGGEAQLGSQEAGALAQVPQEAMLQATGPALKAAGETAGLAEQQAGLATGFGGMATQQDLENQKSGLWSQLWKLYDNAAQGAGAGMAAGG